jgi:hypothetical protein
MAVADAAAAVAVCEVRSKRKAVGGRAKQSKVSK